MEPKICPNCKKEIPAGAELCESCRAATQPENPDVRQKQPSTAIAKVGMWVAVAALFFGFLDLAVIFSGPYHPSLQDYLNMLLLMAPLLALLGFILSFFLVFFQDRPFPGTKKALASLALNILILFLILFSMPMIYRRSEPRPRRVICCKQLKQIYAALQAYAADNGGRFPPIDDTRNNFIFSGSAMYPKYLKKLDILACPYYPDYNPESDFRLILTKEHPNSFIGRPHADCVTDMSYCYLGWLITTKEEAEAFFDAYDHLSPEDYDKDVIVPEGKGNAGGNTIHRLTMDVGRFLESDLNTIVIGTDGARAIVPILWDKPSADIRNFAHVPAAIEVLYLDGHVEYHRYDKSWDSFPMGQTFSRLLDERPRAPIPDCEE